MDETLLPLKTRLLAFGFSDKEATVYVTLLALGKAAVSRITAKAGINRTTGYDILSSLVRRGVVSVSGKEPKQEYVAEPPAALTAHLERESERLKDSAKQSEQLVQELGLIYAHASRPRIRFYEGTKGLQRVYEDTLTSSEPIRAYATVDDMHKALPDYFPTYYKRRAKKDIAIRAIVPQTPSGEERRAHDAEEKREIAFVPPDRYYFSPEINIYDGKVLIASWREKLGIIIESQEIADAMKKIYELAWAEAKRLDSASK
jgi:sugar-specific transcriptional regulator TrmB